ncbi:MAG: T9SS type A sorting domain-containing protein [Bacteroidota bacterium]|nr:T9SS type A sorting domain-containing protein [Bacteroidota bacterium]
MKLLFSLFGLLIGPFIFSQILTVNPGSSVSISSGSSLNLDGLEIAPADTYVISGSNDVSRSVTAATASGNNSILRVYNTSALLSGFTGTLTFSYLDEELNGINEGDLVMELQADDDSWTTYVGAVDQTNNTVSYTFTEAVSFKAVTASASGATLTVEDILQPQSGISVYPNPTANRIYIQGKNILQAELFDLRGRKVKATTQNQLDLSGTGSGSFILKVTTDNNKTKSFKIIKR